MAQPLPSPRPDERGWGRAPLGLRTQILVGLGFVTAFAMLSTGYLALWAAGSSVVSQREAAARAVAGGLAAAAGAVVDGQRPLASPETAPASPPRCAPSIARGTSPASRCWGPIARSSWPTRRARPTTSIPRWCLGSSAASARSCTTARARAMASPSYWPMRPSPSAAAWPGRCGSRSRRRSRCGRCSAARAGCSSRWRPATRCWSWASASSYSPSSSCGRCRSWRPRPPA